MLSFVSMHPDHAFVQLWVVDRQHFYVGSANFDWRSLSQVKEVGLLVKNCACLAQDVAKIWDVYWALGRSDSLPASGSAASSSSVWSGWMKTLFCFCFRLRKWPQYRSLNIVL